MRRIAVIGAGAAGVMAAIFAARGHADVVLIERTRDGGRKILISGGGRCNVLPARLDETRFVTDSSPNTLRKIVRSWPLAEQIAFFQNEVGIALIEEADSAKLFPASHRARAVRDALIELAKNAGVRLLFDTRVTDIVPLAGGWQVRCENAPALEFAAVIIATGGLSVPATGSDGDGLRILERLGHALNPTYAALTPITDEPPAYSGLAGISLPVTITARDGVRAATASGGFLFTHRGYSGPGVLDVSHVAVRSRLEQSDPRARLIVRWTTHTEKDWDALLRAQGGRTVAAMLRAELPERLTQMLCATAGVPESRTLADLTRAERKRLVDVLVRFELPWTGDEGYRKAEVTGGGVRLAEIDPRTMESRRQPGLFLCGEVLDAFGPIGGYNFFWAWATGRAAGTAAARSAG